MPGRARRPAIATAKKRKTRAPARRAARPARPARARARAGAEAPGSEHPIGEGVADRFALDRLAAPARLKRSP
jgi:hypothetical protein